MTQTPEGYLKRTDRLLNDLSTAPQDSLNGIVLLHPHISILQIGNTVVRKDYTEMQSFKILSGGPSGHEPMYSGYVGKGMLSAAVQGDVFKSPTTYDILNVIKELAFKNMWGVLLIIQNTSCCGLNFALAVEKAISEGINVKCLITSDDCSEPMSPYKSDQPQGLTGTVITLKVAGAMADGFSSSLNEVLEYCIELQKQMSTALLVLKPCSLVATAKCVCTEYHDINIGGGLRTITSSKNKLKCLSAAFVVNEVVKELSKNIIFESGVGVVVMINNMCCSTLEENIFTSELLKKLMTLNIEVTRIYVGTFMTALDLQGFTVTLIKSSEMLLSYLDYPTEAPSWRVRHFGVDPTLQTNITPRIRVMSYPRIVPKGPCLTPRQSNILLLVIQFACDALISCRRQLDIMDAEMGAGDVGLRLEYVANIILKGLQEQGIDTSNMFAFFKMLAKVCDSVNGSMGAIYSILFESCANTFASWEDRHCSCEIDKIEGEPIKVEEKHEEISSKSTEKSGGKKKQKDKKVKHSELNKEKTPMPTDSFLIDENVWIYCLQNAVIALKTYTKNEDSANNMLAPLVACSAIVQEKIVLDEMPILQAFELGVAAAEEAAVKTTQPRRKYPDPGAHAVGIWLRAVYEGVKFRCQF